MSLAAIREGLALNLAAIPGVQVSAYILANATPPVLEVLPGDPATEYDMTFRRGSDRWNLTIRGRVGNTGDIGAQKRLDRMLAPTGNESVKQAAETDRTLGGKADAIRVTTVSGYRTYMPAGGNTEQLGAEWTVEVFARNDTAGDDTEGDDG
jgi:hypothetical protein